MKNYDLKIRIKLLRDQVESTFAMDLTKLVLNLLRQVCVGFALVMSFYYGKVEIKIITEKI